MYNKKSGRVTFKSNRRPGFKRNNNYLNSKGRNKGNISQQYNKYLKLAKEALASGDRIQSEYYYQFTDHYFRLMVEAGINIEENDTQEIKIEVNDNSENITEKESESNVSSKIENADINNNEENIEQDDSIESIPFIAEPAKKKRAKSLK